MKTRIAINSPARGARTKRRGAIAVLAAFLMIPMLAMVALAVDYGYLLNVKTDLQRAADAAALAAVRELEPSPTGYQNLSKVRSTAKVYAAANIGSMGFTVLDSDIQIGRYDPATVYSNFTINSDGIFDTVRVTLRRDGSANSPVGLFFAKVLGINTANVTATATAVLQKATILEAGADVLPFSIHESVWDSRNPGEIWSIYGDGRVIDNLGMNIPGNWGTVDIGPHNNSTSSISDQILNGLRQSDLNSLYADGRIPDSTHIDSTNPWLSSADTGLSSGLKSAVEAVQGKTKLIPIYDSVSGSGETTEYRVVGWGVVIVKDSHWGGANDTYVKIQKSYTYDRKLIAQKDLSNSNGVIDGAYTTPVLVQ